MKISSNEHSSLKVVDATNRVYYFDPFHIEGSYHDADFIFITHSHYDHFDPPSIENVANKHTIIVAPRDVCEQLKSQPIACTALHEMAPAQSLTIDGISIEAIPAYNVAKAFHPKESDWVGYIVTIDKKRLYVCGDTDANPEALSASCDIICIPVGGTYTFDAEEATAFVNHLSPAPLVAIPTHYGTVVGDAGCGAAFAERCREGIDVKFLY